MRKLCKANCKEKVIATIAQNGFYFDVRVLQNKVNDSNKIISFKSFYFQICKIKYDIYYIRYMPAKKKANKPANNQTYATENQINLMVQNTFS